MFNKEALNKAKRGEGLIDTIFISIGLIYSGVVKRDVIIIDLD